MKAYESWSEVAEHRLKGVACSHRLKPANLEFRLLHSFQSLVDSSCSRLHALLAIHNDEYRGSCAAQSHAQNAVLSGQRQQTRQQGTEGRAVGLVNTVSHGHAQQIASYLGKGQSQQR